VYSTYDTRDWTPKFAISSLEEPDSLHQTCQKIIVFTFISRSVNENKGRSTQQLKKEKEINPIEHEVITLV
jgi:hypothetical protein